MVRTRISRCVVEMDRHFCASVGTRLKHTMHMLINDYGTTEGSDDLRPGGRKGGGELDSVEVCDNGIIKLNLYILKSPSLLVFACVLLFMLDLIMVQSNGSD